MGRHTVLRCTVAAALAVFPASGTAQTRPAIDELLARVGERIAEFYRRAQNVICIEKSTVQPIGRNYSPEGFSRTVESELHVEPESGDVPGEAKFVREIRKVNGRVPREKDKNDRNRCTDPNPLTTEPLAFLLPAHRAEYEFMSAGMGKEKNRNTLLIDFTSTNRKNTLELQEDPRGLEGCYGTSGDAAVKGRIWVDAVTYDVVRVDERISGPMDVRVPDKVQRRHHVDNWLVIERHDVTIRYKTVTFSDPEEVMLLPESIDYVTVYRGFLESTRRSQTYSDYKRFVTAGRIVKEH